MTNDDDASKKPLPRERWARDVERKQEARRVSRLLDAESGATTETDPDDPSMMEVYGLPAEAPDPAPVYGAPEDAEPPRPPQARVGEMPTAEGALPSEPAGSPQRVVLVVIIAALLIAGVAAYTLAR